MLYHQSNLPPNTQARMTTHIPFQALHPLISGRKLSSNEDSPGLDFISDMVRGHEEAIKDAVTFSIVIWACAQSPQNIEGWGGERSRNVNHIAKAMKAAITGGTKGPLISSHPHHIDIKDKQDGSTNFQCMRINFDARADRNLFCQERLMVQNLRAYAIKIEVGQEEGGTTMNPSTMMVNWCEEEQVEEKK